MREGKEQGKMLVIGMLPNLKKKYRIRPRSLRIKIRSVHQHLGLINQSEIGVFSRVNVYISYAN